ncbi:LysE family translocator [Sphaerisporangium aureirubrum]|uniref:LysE family translocator n=1 Tax=Sphaerisporangium aureirubrum TaxID=1544736 RepID=A0ABW1NJD1_9ACTN
MDWSAYGVFVTFAVIVVLLPGADFAVVVGNTLSGGRRRGSWSAIGVTSSNMVQGAAGAAGLGALIAGAQPVLQVVKWAGVLYLLYLGARTVRSAVRGRYAPLSGDGGDGAALGGWRQGFLSNITNPKVLMFYLAVLPQFLPHGAGLPVLLLFAVTHALLSLTYLLLLTTLLHRIRPLLTRRPVRQALDAATGLALLAFGARLATERV